MFKRVLLCLLFLLAIGISYSQDLFVVNLAEDSVYAEVDQKPEFIGGEKEMFKYISGRIKYPPLAREKNTQGTVVIGFIVNLDGSLDDIKVLKGIGNGCDEEALKLITIMPPWKPALVNGKAVRCRKSIPISFKLM